MPDFLDHVQDRVEAETAQALADHAARRHPPAAICICGCGETVEPERFAAGACRTMECQREYEAKARQQWPQAR